MKKILLIKILLVLTFTVSAQCYETLTFGGYHTVGQKPDGTLWGWGATSFGNLLTTNITEPTPIQMGIETDWDKISNGSKNTFAIRNNGTLWGCGGNQYGSLGVNSMTQTFSAFQQITMANDWIRVSASNNFTLALKVNGTIWAWGQNDEYQLGNSPATPDQLFPLQVGTDNDWVEIAAGTSRTAFAIKSDGSIWGWGSNPSSIIVFGSSTSTVAIPTQVGTDTDWLIMSVGAAHILAQKQDSTLWSWGGGEGLGFGGTPTVTNTPQQISVDKWISFSTGIGTSYGVKEDGTLWSWGRNSFGQLGDGTTADKLVPVQIGTETNWNDIKSRGSQSVMATKTDGTVWYWGGTNYYGEYGNGSSYGTTYIMTPTQTQGICVTPSSTGPTYTNSTIGAISGINPDGTAVSVGDNVSLTGVVHCQNFSNSGYNLTMIDSNNDGINLFSLADVNGYIPTEGDEIKVDGEIEQFNGLIRINPASITVLQQGAALQTPTTPVLLDESTESQFIRLENLELVNGETTWPSNGNIAVTNTIDTFMVNITGASALAGTPTPLINFHLTGIGKQDDASNPFDSGYQIYPCGVDPYCDIDISTTLNNETISVNDTGLAYQWIDCADSSAIAGETGESFTATTDGNYAVIITQGPCVDTSACVFVDVLGLEGNELKGISVYPNPITDELNISNENGALISVEIIDAKGSVVVASREDSKSFSLNTGQLNSGIYILILRTERNVKTFKVVK
jgi:alpha-tubulin suppressor-like RCC1 family protein